MKIELFYDKECPFCNSYAKYIKLKEEHQLILFNAREEKNQIQDLKEQGFDINDGFIVLINDGEIYQGAEAIVFLNKISQKRLFFPDNSFFKTYIYTFIKMLRKLLLILIRKDINIK